MILLKKFGITYPAKVIKERSKLSIFNQNSSIGKDPHIVDFGENVKIVPIVLLDQGIEVAQCLGEAIAKVIQEHPGEVVYIASSDWNHYEPHDVTVKKDMMAIEKVLNLDTRGFYDVIARYDISVCGYGPVATAIEVAKRLGVKEVKLLKHATSGDTSGYYLETVGYAAIAFYI